MRPKGAQLYSRFSLVAKQRPAVSLFEAIIVVSYLALVAYIQIIRFYSAL